MDTYLHMCVGRWVRGWAEGWADKWMEGWVGRWMGGWTDRNNWEMLYLC